MILKRTWIGLGIWREVCVEFPAPLPLGDSLTFLIKFQAFLKFQFQALAWDSLSCFVFVFWLRFCCKPCNFFYSKRIIKQISGKIFLLPTKILGGRLPPLKALIFAWFCVFFFFFFFFLRPSFFGFLFDFFFSFIKKLRNKRT